MRARDRMFECEVKMMRVNERRLHAERDDCTRNQEEGIKENCFSKMGQPRPLFSFIFGLFQTNNEFLQQINLKKCPSCGRRWDSNLQPLKHESSPITTRPGLPHYKRELLYTDIKSCSRHLPT